MKWVTNVWILVLIISIGMAAADEKEANPIEKEVQRLKAEYERQIAELRRELDEVKNRLKRAERRLETIGRLASGDPDLSQPDGKLKWVNAKLKVTFINLGKEDGIDVGTTFVVYDSGPDDRGGVVRKGIIEVTRLVGPHVAEARIREHQLENPLLPGNLIFRVQSQDAKNPKVSAARKDQPRIDGLITSISDRHVEISVGEDDGVKKGFHFEVFRDRTFVCRILIVKTMANSSVGEVVKETLKAPIKKGDRITSRF